jgi:hypothetical protein
MPHNPALPSARKTSARTSHPCPMSFGLVISRQSAPLELELSCGKLCIPCGVDAATLRTVLAVLRERA